MERNLAWYWRRLRAMPPAEVVHRTYRALRHPVTRALMRAGVYAPVPNELADWRGPRVFYFNEALARTPITEELRARADRLCNGEREVLGLGWLELPAPPWHIEPSLGAAWPLVDAARSLGDAPTGYDARLTWEMNRGHEWVVLARAWAATRATKYRERIRYELGSWQQHNPLGMGVNWASAMEAAIRIHSLAWVAAFLRGEPLKHIAIMIHTHAAYVRNNLSEYSSANNHLLVELSALAVAARVLKAAPDHYALNRIDAELERQIYPDGVHAEMATHYHIFVLEALQLVAELERAHATPRIKLETVVTQMADYVAAIRCDDGSVLHQGDNDDGVILPSLDLSLMPNCIVAAAKERRSRLFPASGQVVLRSKGLLATFDGGAFGWGTLAAHAHCDALAVNVALNGSPFLVDRGTYRYNGSPLTRAHYRGTAAHNTVQLEGTEQAVAAGPFLWLTRPQVMLEKCEFGTDVDIAQASIQGGPSRQLVRFGDLLAILDRGSGQLTARFHLAPNLKPRLEGQMLRTNGAWLWTESRVQLTMTEHSSMYAARTIAHTLEVRNSNRIVCVIGRGDEAQLRDMKMLLRDRCLTS